MALSHMTCKNQWDLMILTCHYIPLNMSWSVRAESELQMRAQITNFWSLTGHFSAHKLNPQFKIRFYSVHWAYITVILVNKLFCWNLEAIYIHLQEPHNSTPRFLTDDEELTEQPTSVRQCSLFITCGGFWSHYNTSVFSEFSSRKLLVIFQ